MPSATVLVVDDEPNIVGSLRRALEIEGYHATGAASGAEALQRVEEDSVDVMLLDVAMPELDGLEVLRRLRSRGSEIPVVMMSGHSTLETAVQATKLGAYDFVEKPLSTDRILIIIANALDNVRLRAENAELRRANEAKWEMVGDSEALRQIHDTIRKAAPTHGRVLITGPNGTGKELVARALHANSSRAQQAFVKVNCAAIPNELIESELFGHERGAFSGAAALRRGRFETAHTGTLFLDEIGDMSLAAQAKVLRVLQEGELQRVGGSATIEVDVRVIAATNKDLAAEIEAGRFREDLFYRLNVVPIELPALRQRKADIPLLARHFLEQACREHGKPLKTLEESAVTHLLRHDWPGNVRELRNVIERLVILTEGREIGPEQAHLAVPAKAVSPRYRRGMTLREMVAAAERDIIVRALADNEGQVSKTANELQLERSHLYKKMRALGVDPGERIRSAARVDAGKVS